jgi:hypothetical protein
LSSGCSSFSCPHWTGFTLILGSKSTAPTQIADAGAAERGPATRGGACPSPPFGSPGSGAEE